MHANAEERLSYTAHKPLQQLVSTAYQTIRFCRKYSTLPYRSSSKGRSSSAAPAERAEPSKTQRARPTAGRAPNHIMTEHATDEEYSSTTKESTVSVDTFDPEPQHFADVHPTLSGRVQFVDPDNSEAWITSHETMEVAQ